MERLLSKMGSDGKIADDVTANGHSRDVNASDSKIRKHERNAPGFAKALQEY